MPAPKPKMSLPFALLEELLRQANALPHSAAATAALLQSYSAEIEDPSQTDNALVRLKEFSWHYKVMRDLAVAGVPEAEWFDFVGKVRNLSASACRARGLDHSMVGRVSSAFRRLIGANQVDRTS